MAGLAVQLGRLVALAQTYEDIRADWLVAGDCPAVQALAARLAELTAEIARLRATIQADPPIGHDPAYDRGMR